MKRLIKFLVLFIVFGVSSCNNTKNVSSSKTNLILKNHSDSLEIIFVKLCSENDAKGAYYLKQYDVYKEASKEIRNVFKNKKFNKEKKLKTAISSYLNAIEGIKLQTNKFNNTKRTIIELFNESPVNQSSIVNTYLISNIFLINDFLTEFNEYDYKFDFVEVEIEPSKKEYNLNDSIEFKIFLKAYNTYLNNKIVIGENVDNENDKSAYDTLTAFKNAKSGDFIYKTKLNHKGKNEISGKYFYFENELPFTFNYYVN